MTKDSKCHVGRAHKKRRNVWEEVAREKERGQRKSFGAFKHGRLDIDRPQCSMLAKFMAALLSFLSYM